VDRLFSARVTGNKNTQERNGMLLDLTRWLEHSALGQGIHNSSWLFPFIEVFHLIAIALLGGAVILTDLRLFGWGLRSHPAAELARDVQPILNIGLGTLVVSGFLLYISEGAKMYFNEAFRFKMLFLLLALVYTYTWHRWTTLSEAGTLSQLRVRATAFVSILLWTGVGIGGRAIGFV
jgi:uncharacterized protein DUF6644